MCAVFLLCYVICVNNLTVITSYFYLLTKPKCLDALLTILQIFPLKFKHFLIQVQRPDFNISLLPHKRVKPSMLTGF